jgi:hypothetical protein
LEEIQHILENKCIPFYIRGCRERSMDAYCGSLARTLPTDQCTLSPLEGEIIVKTVKHACTKQISIHPRFLEPWKPVVGGEAVITNGPWFSTVGVVERRQGNDWIVSFLVNGDDEDFVFGGTDIAPLEPLK